MDVLDEDEIIINVEDTEIKCNRKKLIDASPYFDAMFNGNFTEKNQKTITLKEVKSNGLKNILKLLETDDDYINQDDIFDTLEGASMLQFDTVKTRCIQLLQDNITMENCLRMWFLCDKLDIHPLADKAKCKSLMDFNQIKDNDSIFTLNIKELHSYLSNTLLHCDNELDVFETAVKWWYEYSKKDISDDIYERDDKNENDYFLIIIRCLDFNNVNKTDINNMLLLSPDFDNNLFIRNVLLSISLLIDNQQVSDQTVEERTAVELYTNCRKRNLKYLPCIVCTECNDRSSNKPKRRKFMMCNCIKTINIHYFNEQTNSMEKLLDLGMHNEERCNALLEGYQMIPYKESLLFFGGEYQYGTADWNKNVWAFNTFTEDWVYLTTLPKERRHFKTIIVDDKLYIIGGTGKYRIIQDDMMCFDLIKRKLRIEHPVLCNNINTQRLQLFLIQVLLRYDVEEIFGKQKPCITTDEWDSIIKLPQVLYSIKCCEYKKSLFVISGKFSNKFGYLYNINSKIWQRLNIIDPTGDVPDDMGDFIIFSKHDYLYIKGTHLIKMELIGEELVVKSCVNFTSCAVFPDEMGYCQTDSDIYMFTLHKSERDFTNIYLLEKWNLEKNKSRLLLQINDSVDITWNIYSGCFTFLHYKVVKDSKCVSDFVF